MDFLARAGAVIDRAHRVAGLLLVIVIVQAIVIISMWGTNNALTQRIRLMSERLPVYAIPGATRGIYSPTEDDLLIQAFSDTVIQSFNTFTYETIARQYEEMKPFMTAEMLTFSADYFDKLVRDANVDRRSQLFVPDRSTLKVEKSEDNGTEIRKVTQRGTLQTIVAGSIVESVPVEMSLTLRKVIISKSNPFGFMLQSYSARKVETQATQPLPPAPPITPQGGY